MDSKNWNVRTFKGYAGGKGDQSPAEVTLVVTTQANTVEQVRQLAQSAPVAPAPGDDDYHQGRILREGERQQAFQVEPYHQRNPGKKGGHRFQDVPWHCQSDGGAVGRQSLISVRRVTGGEHWPVTPATKEERQNMKQKTEAVNAEPVGTIKGPFEHGYGNNPNKGGVAYMVQGPGGWLPVVGAAGDAIQVRASAERMAKEILREVGASHPRTLTEVEYAALFTFLGGLTEALRDNAERFSCSEANDIAALFTAFGQGDWAKEFIEAHADGDEDGDDEEHLKIAAAMESEEA